MWHWRRSTADSQRPTPGRRPAWPDLRGSAAVAGVELQGLQTLLARSGSCSRDGSRLPECSHETLTEPARRVTWPTLIGPFGCRHDALSTPCPLLSTVA